MAASDITGDTSLPATDTSIPATDAPEAPDTEPTRMHIITDVFDATVLRDLESFDDCWNLLEQEYGSIEDANKVIGIGFTPLTKEGKSRLVGEPFVIVHAMFPESREHKDPTTGEWLHYAVLHIMTKDGRKYMVSDGGVGIYPQVEEWAVRTGRSGGLFVGAGLRESEYDLPDGSGKGKTFYLAV
jgi:hypothetical protein